MQVRWHPLLVRSWGHCSHVNHHPPPTSYFLTTFPHAESQILVPCSAATGGQDLPGSPISPDALYFLATHLPTRKKEFGGAKGKEREHSERDLPSYTHPRGANPLPSPPPSLSDGPKVSRTYSWLADRLACSNTPAARGGLRLSLLLLLFACCLCHCALERPPSSTAETRARSLLSVGPQNVQVNKTLLRGNTGPTKEKQEGTSDNSNRLNYQYWHGSDKARLAARPSRGCPSRPQPPVQRRSTLPQLYCHLSLIVFYLAALMMMMMTTITWGNKGL